jgi:hypothetical protein
MLQIRIEGQISGSSNIDQPPPLPKMSAREQLASCRDADVLDNIESQIAWLAEEVGKVCVTLQLLCAHWLSSCGQCSTD